MKKEIASKLSRKRIFLAALIFTPIIIAFSAFAVVSATIMPPDAVVNPTQDSTERMMIALSAALAVGSTGIAAAWALTKSGPAAISSLTEKPETFFKAFLVVTLCETIAIYGLIISILLWLRL